LLACSWWSEGLNETSGHSRDGTAQYNPKDQVLMTHCRCLSEMAIEEGLRLVDNKIH
jgi:hypothetical protein